MLADFCFLKLFGKIHREWLNDSPPAQGSLAFFIDFDSNNTLVPFFPFIHARKWHEIAKRKQQKYKTGSIGFLLDETIEHEILFYNGEGLLYSMIMILSYCID